MPSRRSQSSCIRASRLEHSLPLLHAPFIKCLVSQLSSVLPLTVPTQVGESDEIKKLWKKRAAMIAADPAKQKLWQDFPDYPTTRHPGVQTFCTQVSSQLVLYRNRQGEFARNWIFAAAENMPAYEWWEQYGSSVPELQTVACIILSQPASASIIERINSEFAFVKDRRCP